MDVAAEALERHDPIAGHAADLDAVIGQRCAGEPRALNRADRRLRRVGRSRPQSVLDEDSVDAAGEAQLALQQGQRDEDRGDRPLPWLERKAAHPVRGERSRHRRPDSGRALVTASLQGSQRDVGRPGRAQNHVAAGSDAEIASQGIAQRRLAPRQRH